MIYKVGVMQFEPEFLKVSKNLAKMQNLLKSVTADLIVLPELANSGYLFQSEQELKSVAEPAQTGDTALLFLELARENNTSYVVGFTEKDSKKFYNSSMLVNPDGEIHVYRKTHLFYEEKNGSLPAIQV